MVKLIFSDSYCSQTMSNVPYMNTFNKENTELNGAHMAAITFCFKMTEIKCDLSCHPKHVEYWNEIP